MIDMYELMGRARINLVPDTSYLAGRRVLVTGAGGSIGSALCRRLSMLQLGELIMLDRDESALHAVQLSITGRALLDDASTVLGDIRDAAWIRHVMLYRRPEVVFHAAALKHLPLLERYPTEAVKTNICGTWTVLQEAANAGVELLVNVSTDKAADPCSVLGSSKRVAERLVAGYAPLRYVSARFGNVLGSRGSVLETFIHQLRAGLPLTVTDPLVSRYFMSVDEAIDFLLYTGQVAASGTALVMNMGVPIRIIDLAERLIKASGSSSEIVFTGARRAERFKERLIGKRETGARQETELVWTIPVPGFLLALEGSILQSQLDALATSDLEKPATTAMQLIRICDWRTS